MNQITGHMKELTKEEWLESATSFISDARRIVNRIKRLNTITFGREYLLSNAEKKLALAEECIINAEIAKANLDLSWLDGCQYR